MLKLAPLLASLVFVISPLASLIFPLRPALLPFCRADLVSGADDVLGWKGLPGALFQYSEPPFRRVPPFLFARLKDSLGDYVVDRGANGATVLAWYHRQFWEIATARYLKPLLEGADVDGEKPESLLAALADYFSGSLAQLFPARFIAGHWAEFRAGKGVSFWGQLGAGDIFKVRQAVAEVRRRVWGWRP